MNVPFRESSTVRSTSVGWGRGVERSGECLEMMSHGRADVGRLVVVAAVVVVVVAVVVVVLEILGGVGGGETGEGIELSAGITACIVAAKSGPCSVVSASAYAITGLPAPSRSRDACFGVPAGVCGGCTVPASASGLVPVHSLDFGFAKAALMSETRAEAFLEPIMGIGLWQNRDFWLSRAVEDAHGDSMKH
jgi:hypothetical protein